MAHPEATQVLKVGVILGADKETYENSSSLSKVPVLLCNNNL